MVAPRFFYACVPPRRRYCAGVVPVVDRNWRIASKFLYGFQMNVLPAGASSHTVLLLAMLVVAALQLPFLRLGAFFKKKGLAFGALTRATNAAGLLTEAFAVQQDLLLYALVQPMQLALLFVAALVRRERPGPDRVAGTLIALAAVCAMTLLIYFFGG